MFVDASALVGMLASEEDAPALFRRLETSQRRLTSPLAVWEASVALSRVLNRSLPEAKGEVDLLLGTVGIETVDIHPSMASEALRAFERFGKGRHRASLNFGDCFAYACAKHHGVPLLFKGEDFSLTDIETA